MAIKFISILFICFLSLNGNTKEIAITFDDAPRFARGYFDGQQRSTMLIEQLAKHKVEQVAFFSVSNKLNAEGIERLNRYARAGHIIANHTDSHPDFNKTSLKAFGNDFQLAHQKLKGFENYRQWFRFPYLREGDTVTKRDGFRNLLAKTHYLNAYITLNNYDWYIESLFQSAIKSEQSLDMNRMRRFYVEQLMASINYYDEMARKHLGRSPKHVLLLHEMDISALFIGDLIEELRKQGWTIITPEHAYSDPINEYVTENVLAFNPGRIGEVAKDKGQKKGLWHYSLDEKFLKQEFNRLVLAK